MTGCMAHTSPTVPAEGPVRKPTLSRTPVVSCTAAALAPFVARQPLRSVDRISARARFGALVAAQRPDEAIANQK